MENNNKWKVVIRGFFLYFSNPNNYVFNRCNFRRIKNQDDIINTIAIVLGLTTFVCLILKITFNVQISWIRKKELSKLTYLDDLDKI